MRKEAQAMALEAKQKRELRDLTRAMLGGLKFTKRELEDMLARKGIKGVTADQMVKYGIIRTVPHDYWTEQVYAWYTPQEYAVRMNMFHYHHVTSWDDATEEDKEGIFVEWDATSGMFLEKSRKHIVYYRVIN